MATVINHNVCHCQSDCQRAQVLTISDCHPLRSKITSLNVQRDQKNTWKRLFELLKVSKSRKVNIFVRADSIVYLNAVVTACNLHGKSGAPVREFRTCLKMSSWSFSIYFTTFSKKCFQLLIPWHGYLKKTKAKPLKSGSQMETVIAGQCCRSILKDPGHFVTDF